MKNTNQIKSSYALSEAISLSKNAGFDALDLKVNSKNINAIKLYKSFGFKKVKKQNIEDIYILKFRNELLNRRKWLHRTYS